MFGLFKKKEISLMAVVDGKTIAMEEVNDPIFAEKMMGDGIAIVPSGVEVVAPCDGTITVLPDSKHAFGMKTKEGLEILVHVGIDTVQLAGEHFETCTTLNAEVKAKQPILRFERKKIESMGIDCTTMVVMLSTNQYKIDQYSHNQTVKAGSDTILSLSK